MKKTKKKNLKKKTKKKKLKHITKERFITKKEGHRHKVHQKKHHQVIRPL